MEFKYLKSLFFFAIAFFSHAQETIDVLKIHKNTIQNYEDLIALAIDKTGYSNYNFQINKYLNINDWDLDGLNDLFIQTGGTPQTSVLSILLNQSKDHLGNITFNFNPNYSLVLEGETGALYKSVSDFNNDGLIDLYHKTQNYHGEPGKQPNWYIPGCNETYDKLFLNTGDGFSKIEVIDLNKDGCPLSSYNVAAYDIDKDNVDEILAGQYSLGDNTNPDIGDNTSELIRYYDFNDKNDNEDFSVNYVFSYPELLDKCVDSPIFFDPAFFYDKGDEIFALIFYNSYKHKDYIGECLWDNYYRDQRLYDQSNQADVNFFETFEFFKFKNMQGKRITDSSNFERIKFNFEEDNDMIVADDKSAHVADIDLDGEFEFIFVYMKKGEYSDAHIKIFESDGVDVTDKWIGWSSYQSEFNLVNDRFYPEPISNNFNFDQTPDQVTGMYVLDIDNDGDPDIIPESGFYFNSNNFLNKDSYDEDNLDLRYFLFINENQRFVPKQVVFPEDHKNSSDFFWDRRQEGFKIPLDLDNDGNFEIIHIRAFTPNRTGNLLDANIDVIELAFDNDNDGIINQNDANPNDPYSNSNDVNGNKIFSLPSNNFSISIENLSCRGSSDGSIAVSAKDENLNYTLTINGNETHNLDPSGGYSKSISNLNPGQYNLCFTVEGQSGYNQCFDINITEPAPLSASSRVNNTKKSISFDLSGSDKYTIVHNGIEKDFDHSNPKIDLKKGVNFLKVKTDKSCQGSYTEEVFISEEVEFYPNPTKDNVNLYIHGKDSTVDIRVIDGDGNILKTSCNEIHGSRKVQINLEEFSKGIYLIQLNGETVDKTVKIVRE